MYRRKDRNLFAEGRISIIFEQQKNSIVKVINQETNNFILNANELEYISYMESRFSLDIPHINFDDVYADSYEDDVPIEYLDRFYSRRYENENVKVKKQIIQYIIPCSGNASLLKYSPASQFSFGGAGGNFEVKSDSLITEIINLSNNAEEIKKQYQTEIGGIHNNYNTLLNDIHDFNSSLKGYITSEFNSRKNKLLAANNLMASLGVPLKKKNNVSATFSVPKPTLREKITLKPIVTEKGFKSEPTVEDKDYQKILKVINDVGKNFERMPSVYIKKGEEDLRDHILMNLDPNFEMGSATGETFNKSGKTDIQLRYDSSVVFIAECKFWSGEKNFLTTITQLLNYLTWRDTKASVVVFVKQKEISSIIEKVKNNIDKHPNFLGFVSSSDINWFNYRFHINGDKNREVKLAIQLFHLPQ